MFKSLATFSEMLRNILTREVIKSIRCLKTHFVTRILQVNKIILYLTVLIWLTVLISWDN
jgi:hypothetical protein